MIKKYSSMFNLDSSVVASVINIESSYDVNAVSKAGAMGLMQLMPSTAEDVAKKLNIDKYDLFNPEDNIEFGCFYIRYLLDMFNDNLVNALCAYNWGLNNVKLWINKGNVDDSGTIINIPVKETSRYITKFNHSFYVYSKIYRF